MMFSKLRSGLTRSLLLRAENDSVVVVGRCGMRAQWLSMASGPNIRMYVGNLDFKTTKDRLQAEFEKFGTVIDVYMPTEGFDERSRGFAFVTMPAADARRAVNNLDDYELDGRLLRVEETTPRPKPNAGFFRSVDNEVDESEFNVEGNAVVRLFVGGVNTSVTEEMLRQTFQDHAGHVTSVYLPEDDQGLPRGFAFVSMPADDALTAMKKLNGYELEGRFLSISEAQQRGPDDSFEKARSRVPPAQPRGEFNVGGYSEVRLFVGNIPATTTENELQDLFEMHGKVTDVYMPRDIDGQRRGFGFVNMPAADAERAMHELHAYDLGGRFLNVQEAEQREGKSYETPRVFNEFGRSEVRMYVGNLAPEVIESDLEDLFVQCGTILDFYMPRDGDNNRGFAFVTMPAEDAKNAFRVLNGNNLHGRPLRVRETESLEEFVEKRHQLRGEDHDANIVFNPNGNEEVRLFVGGVSANLDERQLSDVFAEHGNVLDCYFPRSEDGEHRGFAFVTMKAKQAEKAMKKLNGKHLEGRFLKINEAEDKPTRAGGRGDGGGGTRRRGRDADEDDESFGDDDFDYEKKPVRRRGGKGGNFGSFASSSASPYRNSDSGRGDTYSGVNKINKKISKDNDW